jgi:hypothetical protein
MPPHASFITVRTRKLYLSQHLLHWILFRYIEGMERGPMDSDCDIQGFFLAVYCRIPSRVLLHMTLYLVNLLRMKLYLYELKIQSVPHSKHSPSRLKKTSHLMLYRELIAVCSDILAKHINALWAERRIVQC